MASTHVLESMGITVLRGFLNGFQALMYVQENEDKVIDFILLDLAMPILDGYETCKQLIEHYEESETQPAKIFAYSGFVNEETRKKALETGFDEILLTPIEATSVEQVILPRL